MLRRPRGVALHQAKRFVWRAVGHADVRRARFNQRPQHTGCGPTGADQQDALACQRVSGVVLNVLHQTGAIGVVGPNLL